MFHFSTVEEALDSLRKGRIILVTDDEDRENEGDLSVPPSMPPRKMSISWRYTAKDLSACP